MENNDKKRDYQICKRCVMDATDPDIVFDENGICNNCKDYFEKEKKIVFKGEEGKREIEEIVDKIKKDGKNKKYDCILGLSGGADSSYVAYLAKKWDLRVLLVHVDNSWNSEISEKNVHYIVERTGFDYCKYQLDWEEFRDLQIAYLKASVMDIEVITDHAIKAAIYDIASKNGIKYILSGSNIATEGIMPKSWVHTKEDLRNLEAIHKRYGEIKLKTYPKMGLSKFVSYILLKGIQNVAPLDYIEYNRKEAKRTLQSEFGWEDYGGKHSESIFTRFYQGYILPRKFNIDKRKAHFSTLICSGQTTREEALKELGKPFYKKNELERDKKYVLEKLNLSEKDFEEFMKLPIRRHEEYGTNERIYSLLRRLKVLYTALFPRASLPL